MRLAFVGTRYHGWQTQNNALTVQDELSKAIKVITNNELQLIGCGRTDTGVHALDFYAHFDIEGSLDQEVRLKLIYRLNGIISQDIVIKDILPVIPEAHARFSAITRTYEYRISRVKDPFRAGFIYRLFGNVDVNLMNQGAELLKRYKDFSSFAKNHSQTKTNFCDLQFARWEEIDSQLIFTITANRFLRNMVRAIAGTLLDLGKKKIDLIKLEEIVQKQNRSSSGCSVPACGLYLTSVTYPPEIFI
jgi:tRNA pseudouridine38-40 synthase